MNNNIAHEQPDKVLDYGLRLACFLGNAADAVLTCRLSGNAWISSGGDQTRPFDGQVPPVPASRKVDLFAGDELCGSLTLFAEKAATPFRQSEGFGNCTKLLASALVQRRDSGITKITCDRYHDFVMEVSEGVWRCELRRPMPEGLTVDEQVQFMFDFGYLAECNPSLARMYGYESTEAIVGIALRELLLPDDPRNHEYLANFVRNGYRLRNAESVEKDREGNPRYFVNNLVGILGPAGFTGAWGTQTDITDYRTLEAKLTEAAEVAAEANKAKSAFLANISHEIRTPLSVILGFADLALDKPDLSADTKGYISSIRRNAEQLSEILGEVLDLSKIEARRMEIEQIRFPLLPMLTEVVSFLDLHAREKGLALSLEKIGALPKVVMTDPTRLRQILTNLISNAIKFTEKGYVKVGVRMVSEAKQGVPLQLEFSVSDSGIGISTDLRNKLFRPYAQAETSTTRRFGGTGLGLHLSKQLTRALGGDLQLKSSSEGNGSTFAFTIMAGLFEGELAAETKAGAGSSAAGPLEKFEENEVFEGKKVLLIEDSEDNQTLIKHYLSAVGIQVEVANNGFEGLSKMTAGKYDLVVLDIQMPGMDGHQVARSMRDQGFSQPIIALTAHAFKEDREKAFLNGFNEYLTKPINRMVLLRTLSDRLSDSSALH